MVRAILFGKLQKIWTVFCDDLFFLLCLADLYIVCSGSSSHHVKLYSLIVHAQNYHPDSLCEWWTKSQLVTHCLIFVDQQILLLN